MGSFNVFCSISGVCIDYSDEVVVFPVEKAKYDGAQFQWIPVEMPRVGKYYDYGYAVDEDGKELFADREYQMIMIHKRVWDFSVTMWDEHDGTTSLFDQFSRAHRKFHEEEARYKRIWDQQKVEDREPIEELLGDRYFPALMAAEARNGNGIGFTGVLKNLWLGAPNEADTIERNSNPGS